MVDCSESNEKCTEEQFEEWSDAMCIRIACEDFFPIKVKDLSVQKDIINRFLNFYLSGRVPKGLSARDIIFAVISIMPFTDSSEKLIWDEFQYKEDGTLFFLTAECQLKDEIKHVLIKHGQNDPESETKKHEVHNEQIDTKKVFNSELHTDDSVFQANNVHVKLDEDKMDDKVLLKKSPEDFTDDSKFQRNDDNNDPEETDVKNEKKQSLPLNEIKWFRTKKLYRKEETSSQIIEYDPATNAAFCASCNRLLAVWDTDTEARVALKYFFGAVALSLMRSIVKSYEHVVKMFKSKFLNLFVFDISYITYSPPSEMCVRKTFKTFRKKDCKVRIMFAKLVCNTKYEKMIKTDTIFYNINILNATLLAPTSNYGMEIINLLQELACCSQVEFETFRVEETAVSWNKVNAFLKNYLRPSKYQRTCHWARIIDSEQFKYLTCENNYELAVVIATFIECETLSNVIWNSRWVKSGSNLEKYKQIGKKINEEYTSRLILDMRKIFNLDLEI